MQHVWGTSWGVTTRLIGAVIMTHGDDSGLVLPPAMAPYQVVIVPIGRENWRETVLPRAKEIQQELVEAGLRVTLDERDERPGWKFAEWELRGVPLRLEIGPKDIEKSQVLIARRDTREKLEHPDGRDSPTRVRELLERRAADAARSARISSARNTRSASTTTRRSRRRWRDVLVSSSRRGAGRPTAKRRSRPTRRRRFATCRSTVPRRPHGCVRCHAPAIAEAWFAKSY